MDSKKTAKAKASEKTKTTKTAAKAAAPAATSVTTENFLFSIPSLHTSDNDYEHLVVAPTKEEACRLLAEARVTEKRPELQGEQRAALVAFATTGYCGRAVEQIEPRNEATGVLAINHHKVGIASPTLH